MPAPTPRPDRRRKTRRSMVGIARDTPRDRLATKPEGVAPAVDAGFDLRVSNMVGLRLQTLAVW